MRIAKEISGNGLVKKGNGNLTLDAVNSYTGGTTISQGSQKLKIMIRNSAWKKCRLLNLKQPLQEKAG